MALDKYTQQLDNLYYNLGLDVSGGLGTSRYGRSRDGLIRSYGKREGTGYAQPQKYFALTDEDLIGIGKKYSYGGAQPGSKYASSRTPEAVLHTAQTNYDELTKSYQNLQDMKARGDTGNYGKNTSGFNTYMKNQSKRLKEAGEELEKFKTFKSGMDTITAGGTIDRVDPYAGKVFDTYKGWVEPPEEIPGQAPIVQGDNMMESTIGGAMAPYLPEDIVSTYNVPKDDSLVASGAEEEETEIGRAIARYA